MPESILEAIKLGIWDYEPPRVEAREFRATRALPGSREKVDVLAERIRRGLPLWHNADRLCLEDAEDY